MASGKGGVKVGRIVRARKDGNDISFVAYNGEKRRAKYAPLATVYGRKNDRGWMLSVALEKNVEFNAAEEWCNLYLEPGVTVQVDESALAAAANKWGNKGGGQRRSAPAQVEGDDEENPFK